MMIQLEKYRILRETRKIKKIKQESVPEILDSMKDFFKQSMIHYIDEFSEFKSDDEPLDINELLEYALSHTMEDIRFTYLD